MYNRTGLYVESHGIVANVNGGDFQRFNDHLTSSAGLLGSGLTNSIPL